MSRLTSEYPERVYASEGDRGRRGLSRGLGSGGRSTGLLVAGLAALGIGAWMAWHFGPDLKRYIKMERM